MLRFLVGVHNNRLDERFDLLLLETVSCHAFDPESKGAASFDQTPDGIRGDAEDARGLRQGNPFVRHLTSDRFEEFEPNAEIEPVPL